MDKQIILSDFLGTQQEEEFLTFDLTEIQQVLKSLQNTDVIDIAHAELLQQQALRGADIISEYLGKIVKTIGYLEAKINSTKNKVALDYRAPDGARTTIEMRKWAGEAAPEVEELQMRLSKAKASKMVLDKKYDILIRTHHFQKDIAAGLRRTILGYAPQTVAKAPEGWE